MAKSKRVADALARLAAAEDRFLASEFLSPAVIGGEVRVRIAGIVCNLKVEAADFEGWGVFRPVSHSAARLVRSARLAEQKKYLKLLPLVHLILAGRKDEQWLAMPAYRADSRLRIEGVVPVRWVEDGQLFEVIHTRFDGAQFWFDEIDPRRDPATAAYLRQALDKMVKPDELSRSGLTAEREAYSSNYWPRYELSEEARRGREEQRLRQALGHAGAELTEYRERGDVYTITYDVDGQRHVSVVSKRDLSVQVAGICLSGEDENFDLKSLVGVIREAQGGGHFVRVGRDNRGMEEDQYWRVHPRQRGG